MNTEIQIRKDQRPILMKSGLVHWVSLETAERADAALNGQTGHTFLKVAELGISINTAQMEGVYRIEQYQDIIKLKQGMWQCEYRKWHIKKGECDCKSVLYQQRERKLQETREAQEKRDLTPEERERSIKKLDSVTEELRQKGILPRKDVDTPRTCIKCPKKLPRHSKYYCSGECVNKAQADGTYGREEELQEAANTI